MVIEKVECFTRRKSFTANSEHYQTQLYLVWLYILSFAKNAILVTR